MPLPLLLVVNSASDSCVPLLDQRDPNFSIWHLLRKPFGAHTPSEHVLIYKLYTCSSLLIYLCILFEKRITDIDMSEEFEINILMTLTLYVE